jgi:hypothetical protein
VEEHQKQTILDLPKVIAVGIASPTATVLTSRFGVAGTLLGLALSSVLITAATDFLKVYLARVPGTVTRIPGGFRKKSSFRNILDRIRLPFSKFSSLPPARRRSILKRSVIAGGLSFLIGLIIVTGLELGVGKSLSCWVWDECSTESSADGHRTTATSTLPSIFGGGKSVSSSTAPEVQPAYPQQPTPGGEGAPSPGSDRGTPSQGSDISGSEQFPSSPQPGQRGSSSGVPVDQSGSYDAQEDWQQSEDRPTDSRGRIRE